MIGIRWFLVVFLWAPWAIAHADQVEMLNGDRYIGSVLTMSADTVFLQSDVLGQLKLPRAKVSTITLGTAVNRARPVTNSQSNTTAAAANPFHDLAANTNLVEGIRKQFLADAGPEANGKFDELLNGLLTGKIDMNALRDQAKSAADQLRALKKDSGGEGSVMLDAYLGILDKFLAEQAPAPASQTTNSPKGSIIIR